MTRLMTARSWAARVGSSSIDAIPGMTRPAGIQDDDGFTLVEVLVAMTLFVIISVSALASLITLEQVTNMTQKRVTASNLARQEIERLRGENLSVSQLDAAATYPSVGGTKYTITPTMAPGATVTCTAGSSRQVTVVVSWNASGARSVRYDTVLSC